MDVRRLLTVLACATALACVGRAPGTGDGDSEDSSSSSSSSESGESESTSEGEGDGESTSSGTFVPEWDVPVDNLCDPFAMDCPEGEKCVAYASVGHIWDNNKCVPVLGDQSAGEVCHSDGIYEATDDCDANSMCWDVMEVDGELVGTCAPFCTGTADAPSCPVGYQCIISSGGLTICIENCDPLAQDCGEGLGCFFANFDFTCIFTSDDIPEGEPCGFINDCAPGNYCADASSLPSCDGAACCVSFCDLDLGPGQCAIVGTECVSFFEVGMAPPEYENVGYCILPG